MDRYRFYNKIVAIGDKSRYLFVKNHISSKYKFEYPVEKLEDKNIYVLYGNEDLIEDDFYSTNINKTNYISFSPNQNLQSVDGTYILISYEASVTFSPPPTLTIYPLDEGNEWSILGKTIANPVTLIVDRSKTLRNYGNLNEKTTFLNDLYIVHDDSKNIYDDVTITFTNIKASNIYVNLPDEYNLVIESSTIDYQKIY